MYTKSIRKTLQQWIWVRFVILFCFKLKYLWDNEYLPTSNKVKNFICFLSLLRLIWKAMKGFVWLNVYKGAIMNLHMTWKLETVLLMRPLGILNESLSCGMKACPKWMNYRLDDVHVGVLYVLTTWTTQDRFFGEFAIHTLPTDQAIHNRILLRYLGVLGDKCTDFLKDTCYLWGKKSKNLQLLDIIS